MTDKSRPVTSPSDLPTVPPAVKMTDTPTVAPAAPGKFDAPFEIRDQAATIPPDAGKPAKRGKAVRKIDPRVAAMPGYEILRELGRGGMGVVYKARHLKLNRIVALKMILTGTHSSPADLARFMTEGEAVAKLQHPNIVQIFETGQHDNMPFFTLEYVEGGSLAARLHKKRLTPRAAARMVEPLARGVHFAHTNGIVHRDLKPDNVLLKRDGTAKITDFGIAKRVSGEPGAPGAGGSNLTQTGAILGTPSYMAPEQASGKTKEIGLAADVYALGAILYRLLAGRPPFEAATSLDTIMQVVSEEPEPVSKLAPRTPRDLEAIVHKCLEKSPKARYASANDLADDLKRFSGGEPVLARPLTRMDRSLRWVRRHPKETFAYGLILLASLLLVVGGGFAFLWRSAASARIRAEGAERAAIQARTDLEDAKKRGDLAMAGKLEAETNARKAREAELVTEQKAKEAIGEQIARFRYLESIRRSQRLLESGGIAPAWEELQNTDAKRRGWEWPFLVQQVPGTAVGNTGTVTSVSFSPDGDSLASGSFDKTVRLWKLGTEGESQILTEHVDKVTSVTFSPDSRRVASGSADKTVHVSNVAGGGKPIVLPHPSAVNCVCFSSDGVRLATAADDQIVRVWDLAAKDGPKVVKEHKEHTGAVSGVSFSPDGQILASTSYDGTVRIWALAAGKPVVLPGNTDHQQVHCVSFSADGRRLAAGGVGKLWVWDLVTGGDPVVVSRSSSVFSSVSFCPDGRRLAAASWDQSVRVWDLGSGENTVIHTWHSDMALCVSFSSGGGAIATASGNSIVVLDLAAGHEPLTLGDHSDAVNDVSFSPDGRLLATASDDKTVRLWNLVNGINTQVFSDHSGEVTCIAFSPDGRRLASGSQDKTVRVRNLTDGTTQILNHPSEVFSICFSPSGSQIATGSMDHKVRLWDLQTGHEPKVIKEHSEHADRVVSVSFCADARRIASGSWDGSVCVWDILTPNKPVVLKGESSSVLSVHFSPDGRRVASGSQDALVRVWDLAGGGEPLILKGHSSAVESVCFSRDGRRLVTGSLDRAVRIWDLDAGGEPLFLGRNVREVKCVGWSDDGRRIAYGCGDGSVRLWEIDCQHLWRLRTAAIDERNGQWAAARFHLNRLLNEETACQTAEMTSGLTSRLALGVAANLVALQSREGRIPIAEIHQRRCRACIELGDWAGADADLARLRQISPGNPEIEKLQTLAKTKKTP